MALASSFGQEAKPVESTEAAVVANDSNTVDSYSEGKMWVIEKLSELINVDIGENSMTRLVICFAIVVLTLVVRKVVTLIFTLTSSESFSITHILPSE